MPKITAVASFILTAYGIFVLLFGIYGLFFVPISDRRKLRLASRDALTSDASSLCSLLWCEWHQGSNDARCLTGGWQI